MAEAQSEESVDGKALIEMGAKWLERIRAAEKREERWVKDAEDAEKAYSCNVESKAGGKVYDFNILHSNVETIVPAIYNSTPVPDVRSRNTLPQVEMPDPPQPQQGQQPDPRAMMAYQMQVKQAQAMQAQIKAVKDFGSMLERAITVQIDDNKLDREVEACAQDGFLAGRGIVRVRMEADENGANERLTYEVVSWRDFRRGPAKRWSNLPWMAFRHCMAREEAERFGDKELMAAQTNPEAAVQSDDDDDIVVWEVWCKEPERYVYFIRDSDGMIIKRQDDPLGLTNFFPVPDPIQPIALTGNLTPVCPFVVYKKLADELDLATRRINAIMRGLKVKGLVAGDAADLELLAQADDNELVVAKGLEGLAQTKGLAGAVMWWPVEQAIAVLKELYLQRDQIKQSIYELTGISDIVRGASNAQETATAQQIKTQWGSLRIQKMQRLVQRLVRDLFIISAEIITTKFSPQTLQSMTGIQITPPIQQLMNEKVMAYYRVDVESDSTVKADTTRIRGEMSEFMNGTGMYFKTMGPLIQGNPALMKPAAALYDAFARNWNLGKQAEDALDELVTLAEQASKQPKPNPEQEKAAAEAAAAKQDAEAKAATLASIKAKADNDAQKHQQDMEKGRLELLKLKMELMAQNGGKEETAEKKPPSESIAFKDLPPEGRSQMAAQAGIFLSPERMAQHTAEQDAKKQAELKAKQKKPVN